VNNPLTIARRPSILPGYADCAGDLTTTGPFNVTGVSTITGSGVLTTKAPPR